MSAREDLRKYQELQPNKTFFSVVFIFLLVGVISGLVLDLSIGYWGPVVMDLVTLAVYLFSGFSFFADRMSAAVALILCLLFTVLAFVGGFFSVVLQDPNNTVTAGSAMQNLLIIGVVGSVSTLALHRLAASFYALIAIGFQVGVILIFRNIPYLRNNSVIITLGVLGSFLIVYYYRVLLEKLLDELSAILQANARLRERIERQNESNRPFVYFGKNTFGLLKDFRKDLQDLRDDATLLLETMNRGQAGAGTVGGLLENMDSRVRSISNRINLVTYSTSATYERPAELLDLKVVAESALYPIKINQLREDFLSYRIDCPGDLRTWDQRIHWIALIEHLAHSSIAFCQNRGKDSSLFLYFSLKREGDFIYFEFQDDPSCFLQGAYQKNIILSLQDQALEKLQELLSAMNGRLLGSSVENNRGQIVMKLPLKEGDNE